MIVEGIYTVKLSIPVIKAIVVKVELLKSTPIRSNLTPELELPTYKDYDKKIYTVLYKKMQIGEISVRELLFSFRKTKQRLIKKYRVDIINHNKLT